MNDTNAHRFLSRKHLVVFGAGYVGGEVARMARKSGARVTILTRNPLVAAELVAAGCEAVIDHLQNSTWHTKIAQADFVLNSVSGGGRGLDGYRQSYLEGMHSVLTWGSQSGTAGRLAYTGSTSVYPLGGGVEISESDQVAGIDVRTNLLVETEELVRQWSGPSCVLRLAGIYGPNRHHLLDQLRSGVTDFPGSGDHHLNLIHRDDAVSAVIAALANMSEVGHRRFNVVDNGRARKKEMVGWLAQQLSLPPPNFRSNMVSSRRPNPLDRTISNQLIKAQLDWSPRYPTFKDGYAELLEA